MSDSLDLSGVPAMDCDSPGSTQDPAQDIDDCHVQCQRTIDELIQTIQDFLGSTHTDAKQCADICTSTVAGCVQQTQEEACSKAGKAVDKLMGIVVDAIQSAYGYGASIGLPIPDPASVIYGIATGDYLGSVGCSQPIQQGTLNDIRQQLGITTITGDSSSQSTVNNEYNQSGGPSTTNVTVTPQIPVSVNVNASNGGVAPTTEDVGPPKCPIKPTTAVFTVDEDTGVWSIPDVWRAYLAGVKDGTLDFACLDPTEQYAWGIVNNPSTKTEVPVSEVTPTAKDWSIPTHTAPEQPPQGNSNWSFNAPPDWSSPDICGKIAGWLAAIGPGGKSLSQVFGFAKDGEVKIGPAWFDHLFPQPDVTTDYQGLDAELAAAKESGNPVDYVAAMLDAGLVNVGFDAKKHGFVIRDTAWSILVAVLDAAGWAAKSVPVPANCNGPAVFYVGAGIAVFEIIEKWVGIDLEHLLKPYRRIVDSACPTEMPSLAEIKRAWFANLINHDEFLCLIRANNTIPEWVDKFIDSERDRPGIREVITLARRNGTPFRDVVDILRTLGVTKASEAADYWSLSEDWPGVEEVLDFARHQVTDPAVVKRLRLDEGLQANLTDELKTWLQGKGLPHGLLEAKWASHWGEPEWGTMVEMWRRFRPNMVPVGVQVNQQDLRDWLMRSRISPRYHEGMLRLATPLMQHRQLRLAYNTGSITDVQLQQNLEDHGYSPADVQVFLHEFKIARAIHWGAPDVKQVVKMFEQYEFTRKEASAELQRVGLDQPTINGLLDSANTVRTRKQRAEHLKVVREQYLARHVDLAFVITELTRLGYDGEAVQQLTYAWTNDLSVQGKEVAAATLCKWLGHGFISPDEMLVRLVTSGYTTANAMLILAECQVETSESAQKEAEKAQAKREKAEKAAATAKKKEVAAQKKKNKADAKGEA